VNSDALEGKAVSAPLVAPVKFPAAADPLIIYYSKTKAVQVM